MLQQAIDLQENAVNQLLSIYQNKEEITFKAPTGSGKTYMMAKFMNCVLSTNEDVIFLVTSLSKADLAKQNYEKFLEYKNQNFNNINPYLINSEVSGEEELFIPTDFNVYAMPTGLSSVDGRLMRGPLLRFFEAITKSTLYGGPGKKIYLIKDECHIATNRIDGFSEGFFTKIINFSATPSSNRGQVPDVEIKEEESVAAKLIKQLEWHETDTFAQAVDKFEEIKASYRDELGINPCMIVQVSNKKKALDEIYRQIMPVLNSTKHQSLKWMLIVSGNKKGEELSDTNDDVKKLPVSQWKNYAKSDSSGIDIIIFKLSLTEGWDIPRACMLYQLRETESDQLDQQVLGRIRRNPRLMDFEFLNDKAKALATTAWCYGIKNKKEFRDIQVFRSTDAVDEIKIKTTNLKELSERENFNISEFLDSQSDRPSYASIFDLYKEYMATNEDIKRLAYNYIDSNKKWWKFVNNISKIKTKYNDYVCNYDASMELTKNQFGKTLMVSLPKTSFFVERAEYVSISNWAWRRKDDSDDYTFDSRAESKWVEVLKDLTGTDVPNTNDRAVKRTIDGTYLFGKNYLENSSIKYQYYLDGATHWSYPDFIMADHYNRIHIMEVKSVNKAKNIGESFDSEEYKDKIEELKKCYKQSSILTGHIFYLPILNGNQWRIIQYISGEERILTKKQFIEFVITLSIV